MIMTMKNRSQFVAYDSTKVSDRAPFINRRTLLVAVGELQCMKLRSSQLGRGFFFLCVFCVCRVMTGSVFIALDMIRKKLENMKKEAGKRRRRMNVVIGLLSVLLVLDSIVCSAQ